MKVIGKGDVTGEGLWVRVMGCVMGVMGLGYIRVRVRVRIRIRVHD